MISVQRLLRTATAAALLCSSLCHAENLADHGAVYLHADPGNFVGEALGIPTVTWTHGETGLLWGNDRQALPLLGASIYYHDGDWWNFNFRAPTYDPVSNTNLGQVLKVGMYANAQFDAGGGSPTRATMNVSGPWGSVSQMSGWFEVLEIAYGPDGDLDRFAVDFRQFESTDQSGPSLYGSLRYNSSVAITAVPEPATYGMLLAGLVLVGAGAAKRSATRRERTDITNVLGPHGDGRLPPHMDA